MSKFIIILSKGEMIPLDTDERSVAEATFDSFSDVYNSVKLVEVLNEKQINDEVVV